MAFKYFSPETSSENKVVPKIQKRGTIAAERAAEQEELFEKPESFAESALRNIARSTAVKAEAAAGLPADIYGGVTGLVNALTGTEILPTQLEVPNFSLPSHHAPIPQENIAVPTSEQLANTIRKPLGGEYLQPQSAGEEISDAVVKDFVPLLFPIKGKIPFARALTAAGAGNLAEWAVKQAGFGEGAGAGAKMLAHLGIFMLGGKRYAKEFVNELYEANREATPFASYFNAGPVESKIGSIKNNFLSKGASFASDKPAVKKMIDNISKDINKGYLGIRNAVQYVKDINNEIGQMEKSSAAAHYLGELKSSIEGMLENYGSKNPEFWKTYTDARDAFKAINDVSSGLDFVKKVIDPSIFGSALTSIFLLGPTKALSHAGGIGAIAAYAGVRGMIPIVEEIVKHPVMTRYYKNYVSAITKHNAPAALKAAKAIDRKFVKAFPDSAIAKKEKEGRYKYVAF